MCWGRREQGQECQSGVRKLLPATGAPGGTQPGLGVTAASLPAAPHRLLRRQPVTRHSGGGG